MSGGGLSLDPLTTHAMSAEVYAETGICLHPPAALHYDRRSADCICTICGVVVVERLARQELEGDPAAAAAGRNSWIRREAERRSAGRANGRAAERATALLTELVDVCHLLGLPPEL